MDIYKAYYILFGIFTEDIESVVVDLSEKLDITILKSDREGDDEIYYYPERGNIIRHLSVGYASPLGYHYSEDNILYPKYLLSCNLFSKDNESEMIIIRNVINNINNIFELDILITDVDFDE